MKTNAVLNRSLFRRFGGNTQSIHSGIMIIHPVQDGMHSGIVFQNKKRVGEFMLHCEAKNEMTQADIDLSAYANTKADDCGCKGSGKTYDIKSGGYIVFYSSKGDEGFHVELSTGETEKTGSRYTTQDLKKGDIVMSLLMRPGVYQIGDSRKRKLELLVDIPDDRAAYQKALSGASMVTLTEKGFVPAAIKTLPGQGLAIRLETDSSNLDIALEKATPIAPGKTSEQKRWVKPVPYVIKKKKK